MGSLIDTPKHSDLIYDVGLHEGEDAEFYLRKGFRVVAFEADPDLADACKARLHEYIAGDRLIVIAGAVVDPATIQAGQKTVEFYKNDNSVWGTVLADWAERNRKLGASSRAVEVAAVDFEDALRTYGVPRYLKVDIEGADMVCINALKPFRERPDYVSLESDKRSFAKIKREIDTLAELGYDAFQAVEQSSIGRLQSPPNPPREGEYAAHAFRIGASGLFGAELPDEWKSRRAILWQYGVIRLGYYLLGDEGLLNGARFRGAAALEVQIRRLLNRFAKPGTNVPGWFDTHARHSSVTR